jgi:hypothetical protein
VRRPLDRKGPAAKVAAGLALALALTAAVSYAAVRPGHAHEHKRHDPAPTTTAPTMPIITPANAALRIPVHPPTISTRPVARFRIIAPGEPILRCRLDKRALKECDATVTYRKLAIGPHNFYVQAQRRGRTFAHATYAWTVLEPKAFTVEPQLGSIGPLYPGAAPSPIPVVVSNPNPVAITVTALRVSADGGPAGCDASANLELTAPTLGTGQLQIAAHGSVSLPSAGVAAPTIALRELEANQDDCKDANFNLSFSGTAGA